MTYDDAKKIDPDLTPELYEEMTRIFDDIYELAKAEVRKRREANSTQVLD